MNSLNFSQRSEKLQCEDRVDELDDDYVPIETLEYWRTILFWVAATLSVLILYMHKIPWNWAEVVFLALFMPAVVFSLVISLYVRFWLMPDVEQKRRKSLLSNSFDAPLIPEKTNKYYNNELPPSVRRLGANTMENAFFAYNITGKMAKGELVKVIVYGGIWLIALSCQHADPGLIVVITQTLFSADILARLFGVLFLCSRNKIIYEKLHSLFLNKVELNESIGTACILDEFVTYESVKAVAGIKQSSKIFHELNDELSKKWDVICDTLGIT